MEDESELVTLKKELKCWESMFARKYGRKPAKDDIDQSSAEIKDSYKRYASLRNNKPGNNVVKPAQEEEQQQQQPQQQEEAVRDNGVFSMSLNKKPKKVEKRSHFIKESCEWRPKLKITSRSITRPVKIPVTDEVIDANPNIQISTSTPDPATPPNGETSARFRKKSMSSTRFKHVSQDLLNTCQDYLNRFAETPLKKDVDPGSESRRGSGVPSAREISIDFDMTSDLMNTSGESVRTVLKEIQAIPNTMLSSERCKDNSNRSISETASVETNYLTSCDSNDTSTCKVNSNPNTPSDLLTNKSSDNLDSSKSGYLIQNKKLQDNSIGDHNNEPSFDLYNINNRTSLGCGLQSEARNTKTTKHLEDDDDIPLKKIKGKSVPCTVEKSNTFDFDTNSEIDYDGGQESISVPKKKKVTRQTTRVNKRQQSEVTQDNDGTDCEMVVPTRGKRKRETEKIALQPEEEHSGGEETSEKSTNMTENVKKKKKKEPVKKSTGNKLVTDNFVKIDIRKKTYVRGIKKMTGAQMKRKEWKKKTAFERPIKTTKTGKSICFKCGGDGHWAKNCKEKFKKKNVNPFNNLDEEKKSLDFEHLNGSKGSYCDYRNGENNMDDVRLQKTSNFSIDDVLEIEPTWPRIPYCTSEYQDADTTPLFNPENGKPNEESCGKVTACLRTFGYKAFREGQQEATARIISGLSTLVILSTGSGKSLCYQLPAYLYYKEKKWVTLVISPLIALMQDQVASLPSFLPGACLNGNMTKLQQQRVITKLKEGKLAVLLVSPETLVSGGFGYGMLPPKHSLPPIAFACIDEAHCLSEWSHNFRPSYLKVCKVLQERYNIKCLLGLTATASLATARSVVHHLGIRAEGSIIRDPHPVPQNLHITASRDDNRDQALIELLQMAPFAGCESIIVYTTRRTETDRLAGKLRTCLPDFVPAEEDEDKKEKKKGKKTKVKSRKKDKPFWWNVDCYHAGLTPAERKRIQNDFMSGDLRIVVATVAFGMGLDKADVRSVIHYNMPKSFENYVQEIGRAGRDGKPAFCHVFLSEESGDLNEIRRHIFGNSIDRRTVEKFVDLAFPPCNCLKLNKKHLSHGEEESDTNATNDCHLGNTDCMDTMQPLSDDEIEMFFSAEYDEICKENVEEMESYRSVNLLSETDGIDGSTAMTVVNEITKDYEKPNENTNGDASDGICSANTLPCDNNSETGKNSEVIESESVSCLDNHSVTLKEKNNLTYCSGHRICLSIDDTIAALDMPEENISTLMSYLEQHRKHWLEVLNPMRAFCTVKCYGGPEQFQLLAKKFHPMAIAVRHLINDDSDELKKRREIDFNFADVADVMCWDVMTVAREVRSLQWNMDFALDKELNITGKSGILVECENLSFHCITAEGVDDDERDEISDFLHQTVLKQEETRLLQLDALYTSLRELSCEYYWQMRPETRVDINVRKSIVDYFMSDEEGQLAVLHKMCGPKNEPEPVPARRWNAIENDIRTLIISNPDNTFTGRAMARIFHGIGSPCFPAINFGRDRRFWRAYLDVDFNELRVFSVKAVNRFKDINVKR